MKYYKAYIKLLKPLMHFLNIYIYIYIVIALAFTVAITHFQNFASDTRRFHPKISCDCRIYESVDDRGLS